MIWLMKKAHDVAGLKQVIGFFYISIANLAFSQLLLNYDINCYINYNKKGNWSFDYTKRNCWNLRCFNINHI